MAKQGRTWMIQAYVVKPVGMVDLNNENGKPTDDAVWVYGCDGDGDAFIPLTKVETPAELNIFAYCVDNDGNYHFSSDMIGCTVLVKFTTGGTRKKVVSGSLSNNDIDWLKKMNIKV